MNNKTKYIYLYLLLLPIIDVITSLMTRFGDFKLSLGMIVKGLTLAFGIIYIVFFSRSRWRKKSLIYLVIMFLYFIIYALTKGEIITNHNYLTEAINAFKYSYFIVITLVILNLFEDLKVDKKEIKRVFFISSIAYAILLLIPIITHTAFSSYNSDVVAGDNGWFYAANETGAITVLLLLGTPYLLDNKRKWLVLIYIPILLSIALIGTKVSYIGMILAVMTIIAFNLIFKQKKGIYSSVVLFVILIIVSTFSPALSNLAGTRERIDEEAKLVGNYKLEDYIHNEFIAKVVMIGLNGREDFFLNNLDMYIHANTTSKYMGIGFSNFISEEQEGYNKLVEIDYLDIFFRYGLIGFIIYFIPLISIIIGFFKNKKTKESSYYFIFLVIGLIVSSIAGHVLSAPAVSIYLALIIYLLYDSYDYLIKEKEITIMALHLGHGGIEKYISSLCLMLQDDFDINIISTYKLLDKPAFDFNKKISITYLIDDKPNKEEIKEAIKNKNIKNIFSEGLKSIRLLYLKKIRNIKAIKNIHSKYIITTRDYHNSLVGMYANNKIIKIATEHNYHNNNFRYYHKVSSSVRGFDYFVLVSDTLREFYQNKVYKPICLFIPNTIDYIPREGTKLDTNNLISVGRFVYEKGFEDLIDVFKLVKEEIGDVKLYLVGDGPYRDRIEDKIAKYHLEDAIILPGYSSQEEISKYLDKAKLYVMTSYTEAFGIVLLEAMSHKVPCIAFDSANGAYELLKDGSGILIKDRNKEDMAKTIIKLLKNEKELNKYSELGYKKAKKYLISNVKKEWLTVLK